MTRIERVSPSWNLHARPHRQRLFLAWILILGVAVLLAWILLPLIHFEKTIEKGVIISVASTHGTTTSYMWQLPPRVTSPRAILFLAHGCSHSMTDWWKPQPSCPQCLGLPEELAIVDMALHKFDLMVVAMSSLDRVRKCWSPRDGPVVARVLKELSNKYKSCPILAFGASSGGSFVSTVLPIALPELNGCISQIAAPTTRTRLGIPAVFVTMNRDTTTDQGAAIAVTELISQKTPARHIRLAPRRLEPDFFAKTVDSYSLETSQQMVHALQHAGYLQQDGTLRDDPRRSNWRDILQEYAVDDSLVADESPLSEVLNAAWGMHEMSREGVSEAIEFLLQTL